MSDSITSGESVQGGARTPARTAPALMLGKTILYSIVFLLAAATATAWASPESAARMADMIPEGWIPESARSMLVIEGGS